MRFDLLSMFKAAPPVKKPSQGEVSFADPSRMFPTGFNTPYNPSELVGQRGLSVFDKMRKDDQVKSALTFKRHSVTAAGWTIKVPEGQDDDWEPAVFCRKVLENVDGSIERSIDGILSAMAYGYSISEKVWAEENGKIVLKSLKTRRPHEWEFVVDPYGNLTGLKQMQKEMPVDKFVVYSYDSEFGNWYGTSDLEAAHRAWWTKKNTYQWMAMLLERMGIPPIMALYNPDAYPQAKLGDLKSLLKNMQAATVGIIPRGAPEDLELWSTEIGGGIEGVFIPALNRFDQDIAKAMLMPGLLGMTSDSREGSFARAKVHFDVFMLVIERTRNEIAKHVMTDQIIRPMVELNFGVMDEYPCFDFGPLTDDLRTDLMTTWGTLVGQKVVTSTVEDEKHVRTILHFPELSPEGEKLREEKEKLEAEQRQATTDGMKQAASMTPEQRAAEAKSAPPKAKKSYEEGTWITIDGRHVFIRPGENPADAFNRDLEEERWSKLSPEEQQKETRDRIAEKDVEYMQAWDMDGKPVFRGVEGVTDGDPNRVGWDRGQAPEAVMAGGTHIHNHPSDKFGSQSIHPSNNDLRFYAHMGVKEGQIVSRDFVTKVSRPPNGWPEIKRVDTIYNHAYMNAQADMETYWSTAPVKGAKLADAQIRFGHSLNHHLSRALGGDGNLVRAYFREGA